MIRRSRVESQKAQHEVHKAERRKQAEIERQFELEARVNEEILTHEEQRERLLRKAVLEDERNTRMGIEVESHALHAEHMRSIAEAEHNASLAATQAR